MNAIMKKGGYMEAEILSASLSIFGTEDYESALAILPAYDGAVKEFKKKEAQIRENYTRKGDLKNG